MYKFSKKFEKVIVQQFFDNPPRTINVVQFYLSALVAVRPVHVGLF